MNFKIMHPLIDGQSQNIKISLNFRGDILLIAIIDCQLIISILVYMDHLNGNWLDYLYWLAGYLLRPLKDIIFLFPYFWTYL